MLFRMRVSSWLRGLSEYITRVGILGAVLVALALLALLVLLTQATNQQDLYERHFTPLLVLNAVIAVALLGLCVWVFFYLLRNIRRGRFGSRLQLQLAAVFALVGVLPGVLVYAVSYQFVNRSIESWFNLKVEAALEAGLSLGRNSLDAMLADVAASSQQGAKQIAALYEQNAAAQSKDALQNALDRVRDVVGASDAWLLSAAGEPLISAGSNRWASSSERPTAQWLRLLQEKTVLTQIDGLDEVSIASGRIKVWVWMAVANTKSTAAQNLELPSDKAAENEKDKVQGVVTLGERTRLSQSLTQVRYVHMWVPIPPTLSRNAFALQEANREYQERALARLGLKRMYIASLTLTLLIAVLGVLLGLGLLANQLTKPLVLLAEGVRQVAQGDLRPKRILSSNDELAALTRDFANMTQQLADSRKELHSSMAQLGAAQTHLQTIMDNLRAGILVFDSSGRLHSYNPAAKRILGQGIAFWQRNQSALMPELQRLEHEITQQFVHKASLNGLDEEAASDTWQTTFEYQAHTPQALNLILRGAWLPSEQQLVVFDDVTQMVSAQRSKAWTEVARRLAHEIKNPLTPIQLSAERMLRKLSAHLQNNEAQLLERSVNTIVDQVGAMKRLVDEFRDFGRLPQADLRPTDLNQLIEEIMGLYAGGASVLRPHMDLDPLCPMVMVDAQQLRQVVHNLVQNAQDAVDARLEQIKAADKENTRLDKPVIPLEMHVTTSQGARPNDPLAPLVVRTRYLRATEKLPQRVRLSVLDAGVGFPEHILKKAFEPYVSTKEKGTGLGLAVVKKIADEHHALLEVNNRVRHGQVCGAHIALVFTLA